MKSESSQGASYFPQQTTDLMDYFFLLRNKQMMKSAEKREGSFKTFPYPKLKNISVGKLRT